MIRAEDWLRDQIRAAFKGRGAHLSWIESHETSAGFPDLDYMMKGVGTQIELKVTKANGAIKIRASQYSWFRDRVRAGGLPYLWVYDHAKELHWAVRGQYVNSISKATDLSMDRDIFGKSPVDVLYVLIEDYKNASSLPRKQN